MTTTNMRLTITHAEARTTVRRVGSNPENADIDNPNGDIYDDFWIIEAYTEKGEVFIHTSFSPKKHWDNDEGTEEERAAKVERLVEQINEVKSINPDLWHYSRIMYGADGWDEQELQDEINDARRAGERHPMDR
jgi:hypothetical protein